MLLVSILALFWEPFDIHFRYFFGIDFCMPFWMPLFRLLVENGRQNGWSRGRAARPKSLQKLIKNAFVTKPRFFIDLGSIWGAILVRRTPPGWRACQTIRINPVFSGIYRPPTPRHGQKFNPKSMKLFRFDFFLASNFGINFREPFFRHFSDFAWILAPILDAFWYHFLYFLHAFFLHRFCIDFEPIFHDF